MKIEQATGAKGKAMALWVAMAMVGTWWAFGQLFAPDPSPGGQVCTSASSCSGNVCANARIEFVFTNVGLEKIGWREWTVPGVNDPEPQDYKWKYYLHWDTDDDVDQELDHVGWFGGWSGYIWTDHHADGQYEAGETKIRPRDRQLDEYTTNYTGAYAHFCSWREYPDYPDMSNSVYYTAGCSATRITTNGGWNQSTNCDCYYSWLGASEEQAPTTTVRTWTGTWDVHESGTNGSSYDLTGSATTTWTLSSEYTTAMLKDDAASLLTGASCDSMGAWAEMRSGTAKYTLAPNEVSVTVTGMCWRVTIPRSDPRAIYEVKWTKTDSNGSQQTSTFIPGNGSDVTQTFGSYIPSSSNPSITVTIDDVITHVSEAASPLSAAGGGGPRLSSLALNLNLGFSSQGMWAGKLFIHQSAVSSNLTSPSILRYGGITNGVEILTASGALRQAKAPQCLADVVTDGAQRYHVRFYHTNQVGAVSNGVYTLSGSPYVIWTVENTDTNGASFNSIRILETRGASTITNLFEWAATNSTWTLTSGNGLRRETHSEVLGTNGVLTVTHAVYAPATSQLVGKEVKRYQMHGFGQRLIEEVTGDGSAARTNTYTYYTDKVNDGDNWRHRKQALFHDGSWAIYQHDSNGRVTTEFSSFGNQSPTNSASLCRATYHSYTPLSGSGDGGALNFGDPRTTYQTLLGTEISRSYHVYLLHEERAIRCQTASAAWDASDNLATITKQYTNGAFAGWPKSVWHPDGTLSLHEYSVDGATNLSTLVWSGQPNGNGTAIVAGTKLVTLQGPLGNVIERTTVDIAADLITGSEVFSDFDEFGRPGRVTYLDSTFKLYGYLCCGLESETDRDGVTTTYGYDALKRRITSTRNSIAHIQTLDAANRVLFTQRQGTNASTITLASMVYDTAGRLLYQTNAVGNLTSFGESTDTNGQTLKFTTNALGGTRIETYFKDGSLKSVTGTAVHGVRYDYGIEDSLAYTKEIKLLTNGTDSAEWTKTFTDVAGRSFKTVYPDSAYTQTYFNNAGQLWKQRDADGVVTLYAFNGEGQVEYTALDMDRDDTIDYDGTDRITRSVRDVVAAHSTNVRRQRSYVWTTDSATNSLLTSTVEAAVDGTRTWQTAFGLTSQGVSLCGGACVATNIAPDGSYTTTMKTNGYVMAVTRYDSQNNQLGATTYTYDEHGRQKTIIDARNGTTTLIYDDADRVTSVTTPVPASGQSSQTTTSYYDDLGRVWKSVQPDSGAVTNEFHLTGELKKTYGARTYPVEHTYDYAGRMQTLKTWQDFAGNTGTATTTWNYSTNRGFLLLKQYQDGNGPSYTYSAAGRLTSRTWARGVVTTNTYDYAGQLATVDYSDSTPDVGFTYDRRGRVLTNGDIARSYNDAGLMVGEAYTGGPLSGFGVTNTYDAYLRRTNLAVIHPTSGLVHPVSYVYDYASRMQTVSDGTNSATYAFLDNSPFVESIVFKQSSTTRMTTTKSYDYLNRLTAMVSTSAVETVASYRYNYNDANQRVAVTNADSSRWAWGYDSLGQVNSGKRYWSDGTVVAGQQYEYAFDTIGNRTSASSGGSQFGTSLRSQTYSANLLNQYTNRTVPGYIEVQGSANSNATVTVNNDSTYRKGDYFRKELSANNTSAAVWQGITNVAVLAGAGTNGTDIVTTQSGNAMVPKTPEAFVYDADGNLTQDGTWIYTWDAENRLLQVESATNAPSGSKLRVAWVYDAAGRRIRQTDYDGSTGSYVLTNEVTFVADGWRHVAEVNTNSVLVKTFVWGLDLSGTLDGAGGVGGLLIFGNATSRHFTAYDGNGNVTTLTAATDGTASGRYEFGPFGEALRVSGAVAEENPFRFSTKRTHTGTGVVQYERRPYIPPLGRWASRDPIEEQGGFNVFGFVNNSPTRFVDRLGLSIWNSSVIIDSYHGSAEAWWGTYNVSYLASDSDGVGNYSWPAASIDTYYSNSDTTFGLTMTGSTRFAGLSFPYSTSDELQLSYYTEGRWKVCGCCARGYTIRWTVTASYSERASARGGRATDAKFNGDMVTAMAALAPPPKHGSATGSFPSGGGCVEFNFKAGGGWFHRSGGGSISGRSVIAASIRCN